MIKKLIKVPKNECFYFGKRLISFISGNKESCFSELLEDKGWLIFPYKDSNEIDPNIIIFNNKYILSDQIDFLDNDNIKLFTKYKIGIIITDIQNITEEESIFFNDIIDISSLKNYYQTELSLKEFKDKILNIGKISVD